MGFWQGMGGTGRGAWASTAKLCEVCDAGSDDQSGKIHSARIFY